jgi:hypothetical protein
MNETPKYKHVVCPQFVRRVEGSAEMQSLSCKLCGSVIAEKLERPLGYEVDRQGNKTKVVTREFVRYPIYTEMRILFDNGSDHVTHGCANCMTVTLPPEVLDELHRADQEESPDGYTELEKQRYPIGVVHVKTGGEPA